MAFVRTALIIIALLIGWTALRHQSLAHAPSVPAVQTTAIGGAG